MPVIVAIVTPKPDQIDAAAAVFTELIPQVHDEDGCERYALHRSKDKLVMIEKWASGEAIAAHGKGPALAELGQRLKDLTAEPMQLLMLDAVPAGDPVKGAL